MPQSGRHRCEMQLWNPLSNEETERGQQQCFTSAWVVSEHRAPGVITGHQASCPASLDYSTAAVQGFWIFCFYMLFKHPIPWPLKGQGSELDEYFDRRRGQRKRPPLGYPLLPPTTLISLDIDRVLDTVTHTGHTEMGWEAVSGKSMLHFYLWQPFHLSSPRMLS